MLNHHVLLQRQHAIFPTTIAHDKGKPAARWGRKAVNLYAPVFIRTRGLEIVWLPKAI
jgi:hypothetical protein